MDGRAPMAGADPRLPTGTFRDNRVWRSHNNSGTVFRNHAGRYADDAIA